MNTQKKQIKTRVAKGFTLIEIMFAVFLISIAIASLVAANGAFTQVNGAGLNLSTAEFLIEEMRELTIQTDYDDLAALNDNTPFKPPVDVTGTAMTEFASFSQHVVVANVNSSTLTASGTTSPDFSRVTVSILRNSKTLSSTSWIRTKN